MWISGRALAQWVISAVLITILSVQPSLLAQVHVLSPADLQRAARDATRARQQNLSTVKEFLSSSKAEGALRSVGLDPERVTLAVSTLSDEDLAQLATRTAKAQVDLAAGQLSERDLLLIILGIAVLVLVIVAVD